MFPSRFIDCEQFFFGFCVETMDAAAQGVLDFFACFADTGKRTLARIASGFCYAVGWESKRDGRAVGDL